MTERHPPLRLNPNAERRLRVGHTWIFSNEVDVAATPLKSFQPGDLVTVVDARNKPVGTAYVNPATLIAARLISGRPDCTIDTEWVARRVRSALALRERLYPTPHYRLVHGESDGLPGLVVDRFGDVLVAQLATAGIERLRPLVVAALQEVVRPAGILFRNDGGARALESLPAAVESIGVVPDAADVDESGVRFVAPIREGQKTGWFYDQRDNRDRLARYVGGRSLLDVFSYVGGWAIRAAKQGAATATCVDSSQP
ncbi:MAG TPA: class I SAM-dependent methyltransferase, partial [Nevskiaceae bacterium]|nr:class I SAM-dependent methyltransferase [Nevskiaceae bacterium]